MSIDAEVYFYSWTHFQTRTKINFIEIVNFAYTHLYIKFDVYCFIIPLIFTVFVSLFSFINF